MTPEQFCYWLQGFLEPRAASGKVESGITEGQVQMIAEHLNTVFHKVTGKPSDRDVNAQKERAQSIADLMDGLKRQQTPNFLTPQVSTQTCQVGQTSYC